MHGPPLGCQTQSDRIAGSDPSMVGIAEIQAALLKAESAKVPRTGCHWIGILLSVLD